MINYQCTSGSTSIVEMKAVGARGSPATVAGFDENNRVVPITSKPRKKLTEMALTPGNEAGGQVGRVWCVLSFVVTEKPPKPPSPRRIPGIPPAPNRDYINRFTHICQLSITKRLICNLSQFKHTNTATKIIKMAYMVSNYYNGLILCT